MYIHLFCLLGTSSNTVTTTMASETALFKKRIVTLIKITNALKDVDLSNTLRNLEERVCITGNLNSGGKFEWIDSTLVKVILKLFTILLKYILTNEYLIITVSKGWLLVIN